MPWWGWALIAWGVLSCACAVWWGLALANADRRDQQRRRRDRSDGRGGAA